MALSFLPPTRHTELCPALEGSVSPLYGHTVTFFTSLNQRESTNLPSILSFTIFHIKSHGVLPDMFLWTPDLWPLKKKKWFSLVLTQEVEVLEMQPVRNLTHKVVESHNSTTEHYFFFLPLKCFRVDYITKIIIFWGGKYIIKLFFPSTLFLKFMMSKPNNSTSPCALLSPILQNLDSNRCKLGVLQYSFLVLYLKAFL